MILNARERRLTSLSEESVSLSTPAASYLAPPVSEAVSFPSVFPFLNNVIPIPDPTTTISNNTPPMIHNFLLLRVCCSEFGALSTVVFEDDTEMEGEKFEVPEGSAGVVASVKRAAFDDSEKSGELGTLSAGVSVDSSDALVVEEDSLKALD